MLTAYLTRTQQLLQNPPATTALYSTADLTSYINTARSQIAGETECIRSLGTLALAAGAASAAFTSVTTGSGIAGVFTVRGVTVGLVLGQRWLAPRPFPYFQTYYINNPVPKRGFPTSYSQFGQGEAGTLYFNPTPDRAYSAQVDAVCVPVALADDSTVEAIPYPYTDAVPYYAAYLAFLSAQRPMDADRMWQQFQVFVTRARQMSNGPVNPRQYAQQPNPMRPGQLGQQGGNA